MPQGLMPVKKDVPSTELKRNKLETIEIVGEDFTGDSFRSEV
jgi:hypothetical protein